MLGHLFIGQQHEFLDEPVGLFRFFDVYTDGLGVFVQMEFHLLAFEVDGTFAVAFFAHDGCQFVQHQYGVAGRFLASFHAVGVDDFLGFLIVVAAFAVDD